VSGRYDDTINAQSTVALLQQIEQQHPAAAHIYVICDNARYYRSRIVTEYLLDSKIELIFLPPHAPNLNLIERYWRFFKKKKFCMASTMKLLPCSGELAILFLLPLSAITMCTTFLVDR